MAVLPGSEGEQGTRFQRWLAQLPQGAFKTWACVILGALVVLAVTLAPLAEALLCAALKERVDAAAACTHLEIPDGALWAVFAFLSALGGLGSLDFRTKRTTFMPTPPGAADVDDVKVLGQDAPTAGRAARQDAREAAEAPAVRPPMSRTPTALQAVVEGQQPQTSTAAAAYQYDPGA